jgi:hypothetical protein
LETWDYDPSIQAMLVVLDDIELRYEDFNIKIFGMLLELLLSFFIFYKLDMDKIRV